MSANVVVAVVSWNTRDLLAECLDSLEEDARGGRAEVWVVDNDSNDGSAELVSVGYPWVTLISPGENLGFGRAVNAVAERTAGEWIVPANADVELTPGALETLVAAAESHPEAALVAPRLVLPDGSTQHSVFSFPTLAFTALFNLGVLQRSRRLADRACLEGSWDPDRAREVPWAIGALVLIRRRAFDDVGRFDERQWMYAEDLDLGWRLARAGWRTRYVPDAAVRHAAAAAASQAFGDERTLVWLQASYAWMHHRRGRLVTAAFGALNIGGAAARFALGVWGGPGPRPGARARRAYWKRWVALHRAALRASRDGPAQASAGPAAYRPSSSR